MINNIFSIYSTLLEGILKEKQFKSETVKKNLISMALLTYNGITILKNKQKIKTSEKQPGFSI